jgi:hypothetical protein
MISFPAAITVYTFNGAEFARLDPTQGAPWFGYDSAYTIDQVLGSRISYLDIGAAGFRTPLSFRAMFLSFDARAAIQGWVGVVETLANTRGRSDTAYLAKVDPFDLESGPLRFGATVTFEWRPA